MPNELVNSWLKTWNWHEAPDIFSFPRSNFQTSPKVRALEISHFSQVLEPFGSEHTNKKKVRKMRKTFHFLFPFFPRNFASFKFEHLLDAWPRQSTFFTKVGMIMRLGIALFSSRPFSANFERTSFQKLKWLEFWAQLFCHFFFLSFFPREQNS